MISMIQPQTRTFDARLLTLRDAEAVRALTGGSLPHAAELMSLLQNGHVLGDYAGLPHLQAVTTLLPLGGASPLALCLRAAGLGTDGRGAVLTPLCAVEGYTQVRHFLSVALHWARGQYPDGEVWAVLPLDRCNAAGEELCAQYMATGLALRAACPMNGTRQMLVFSAQALPRWEQPIRRLPLCDPALPRFLERGYAAADFGWDRRGLVLLLRPTGY